MLKNTETDAEIFINYVKPQIIRSIPLKSKYRDVFKQMKIYIPRSEIPDYQVVAGLAIGSTVFEGITQKQVLDVVKRQCDKKGEGWWRNFHGYQFSVSESKSYSYDEWDDDYSEYNEMKPDDYTAEWRNHN
jgi:hypothetical protein